MFADHVIELQIIPDSVLVEQTAGPPLAWFPMATDEHRGGPLLSDWIKHII